MTKETKNVLPPPPPPPPVNTPKEIGNDASKKLEESTTHLSNLTIVSSSNGETLKKMQGMILICVCLGLKWEEIYHFPALDLEENTEELFKYFKGMSKKKRNEYQQLFFGRTLGNCS